MFEKSDRFLELFLKGVMFLLIRIQSHVIHQHLPVSEPNSESLSKHQGLEDDFLGGMAYLSGDMLPFLP